MIEITKDQLRNYRPLNNMVLIKPTLGQKEVMIGDIKFQLDTSYEEEIHAPVTGTVVAVPYSIFMARKGFPGMWWDVDMEIEVGDYAIYDYLQATTALDPAYAQAMTCEGELYLLIPYEGIFVVRRQRWQVDLRSIPDNMTPLETIAYLKATGELPPQVSEKEFTPPERIEIIIPVNGFCLIEPIVETPDHPLLKNLQQLVGNSTEKGIVRHVSKGLIRTYLDGDGKPDTDCVKPGDVVAFDFGADLPLEYPLHSSVEGKQMFYRIQRRYINAIVREVE